MPSRSTRKAGPGEPQLAFDDLLGSIGDIPPAEAEANHHAALEATPMAA